MRAHVAMAPGGLEAYSDSRSLSRALSSDVAMLTNRSISLALALAALIAGSAAAAPLMRYSWDDCGPVIPRRDFIAPTVYTQTVSVLALDQPVANFRLVIRVMGPLGWLLPGAWLFGDLCTDPPYSCGPYALCCGSDGPPCQPIGRVSTLFARSACDTIPGLQVSAHFEIGPTSPALLIVDGTADGSFTPDPARRYTLVRMAFDHSGSVAGLGGPGTCGYADWGLWFQIGELYLNGVDERGRAIWENCVLAWNTPAGPFDCPLVVPTRKHTWGQVKTLYR
jgi:hypothetical protein